jgi:hypothetical protein
MSALQFHQTLGASTMTGFTQRTQIIPFGKYKGQPIEAMAQDPQYCDWLVQQPWLKDRFPNLHTIIINNFVQPSETPEHNKLQALFLKKDFLKAFDKLFVEPWINVETEFETQGFDVVVNVERYSSSPGCYGDHGYVDRDDYNVGRHLIGGRVYVEIKPTVSDDFPECFGKSSGREKTDEPVEALPCCWLASTPELVPPKTSSWQCSPRAKSEW